MLSKSEANRGYALVAILWIACLLALLALAVIRESRSHLQLLHVMESRIEARAILETEITRYIARMRGNATSRMNPNIGARNWQNVSLELRPENEKLDLNVADGIALKSVISTLTNAEQAAILTERIMDWRDTDDLVRTAGAESRDYREAGIRVGPRNGPFAHSTELTQVLGVSPTIALRLAERVSVYSGVRYRDNGRNMTSNGVPDPHARREPGVYTLLARTTVARMTLIARVTLMVNPGPNGNYRILAWQWG